MYIISITYIDKREKVWELHCDIALSIYYGQNISKIYNIQTLRYHNGAHMMGLNTYLISLIMLCHTKLKNITQYLHNI